MLCLKAGNASAVPGVVNEHNGLRIPHMKLLASAPLPVIAIRSKRGLAIKTKQEWL